MNDHDEMVINFQVGQLVTKYNEAWDAGRFVDVGSCFTSSGVFVDATGEEHRGRPAIVRFGEKSRSLFGAMRHLTTNHVVDHHADAWTHRCYILFVSGIGRPDKAAVSGHYEDEFVVEPEGPLFTIRRVFLDS